VRPRHAIVKELADTLVVRDGIVKELRENAGKISLERYKLYIDAQDKVLELSEELRMVRKSEEGREDDT